MTYNDLKKLFSAMTDRKAILKANKEATLEIKEDLQTLIDNPIDLTAINSDIIGDTTETRSLGSSLKLFLSGWFKSLNVDLLYFGYDNAVSQKIESVKNINIRGAIVNIVSNGKTLFSTYLNDAYLPSGAYIAGNITPLVANSNDLASLSYPMRDIYSQNALTVTSDRNKKKDIVAVTDEQAISIMTMSNPVLFRYIDNTSERLHAGFIAQEVEDLLATINLDLGLFVKAQKTEIVIIDGEEVEQDIIGEFVYSLRYTEFIAIQAKFSQIMWNKIAALEAK